MLRWAPGGGPARRISNRSNVHELMATHVIPFAEIKRRVLSLWRLKSGRER